MFRERVGMTASDVSSCLKSTARSVAQGYSARLSANTGLLAKLGQMNKLKGSTEQSDIMALRSRKS